MKTNQTLLSLTLRMAVGLASLAAAAGFESAARAATSLVYGIVTNPGEDCSARNEHQLACAAWQHELLRHLHEKDGYGMGQRDDGVWHQRLLRPV